MEGARRRGGTTGGRARESQMLKEASVEPDDRMAPRPTSCSADGRGQLNSLKGIGAHRPTRHPTPPELAEPGAQSTTSNWRKRTLMSPRSLAHAQHPQQCGGESVLHLLLGHRRLASASRAHPN